MLSMQVSIPWKIIAAYLKGFLFRFRDTDVFVFMQIMKVMMSLGLQLKMVYNWIKNISENIEAEFFKLGTRNICHKRNQMTPIVLLPLLLIFLEIFFCCLKSPSNTQHLFFMFSCHIHLTIFMNKKSEKNISLKKNFMYLFITNPIKTQWSF